MPATASHASLAGEFGLFRVTPDRVETQASLGENRERHPPAETGQRQAVFASGGPETVILSCPALPCLVLISDDFKITSDQIVESHGTARCMQLVAGTGSRPTSSRRLITGCLSNYWLPGARSRFRWLAGMSQPTTDELLVAQPKFQLLVLPHHADAPFLFCFPSQLTRVFSTINIKLPQYRNASGAIEREIHGRNNLIHTAGKQDSSPPPHHLSAVWAGRHRVFLWPAP